MGDGQLDNHMPGSFVTNLQQLIGNEQVSTTAEVLQAHSHDASSHPAVLPDIVIWPKTTKDVSAVLAFANAKNIPVTAFGSGTSLEGNPIPSHGGIVLDLTRMHKVVHVFKKDLQVVVEPGITGIALNKILAEDNLYFPAFPASSAIASIGGMIANNAGGMYAVKYGVVGDWVLTLEVVLADGTVITTGSRSIKSVAGYDLQQLFIGSEGTLGIITKATLRVIPTISHKLLTVVSFPTVGKALQATLDMLSANVDPAAVEFLGPHAIHFVNTAKHVDWKEAPTILIELHGIKEEMNIKAELIKKIAIKNRAISVTVADSSHEQKSIWEARSSIHPSIAASTPDAGIVPGDIGVPISQIPTFMNFVEEITQKNAVRCATFGHIGDGNFHVWLIFDKKDTDSFARAKKTATELVDIALKLGGTCTAEHGVGIGKRGFLQKEHASSVGYMQQVKKIFDPNGILNPGKIFV